MKHRSNYFIVFILLMLIGCGSFFDKDQAELKRVIRWYDDALVKVYRQLDIKPLDGLASEREMTRVKMMLVEFDRKRKIMESELVELKFIRISLENGNRAEVETREKWRYRYLGKGTNLVVKPWTDVEYRMKYEMVKSGNEWIVGLVRFADDE
ncbi:MAG: hypothetical protein RQ824_12475 [bacterium]|nr:hypothetical protein [bacterium]